MSLPSRPLATGAPVLPGLRDLRLIGRGSFAAVYRAIEDLTFREVAVKVLHREISPELVERAFLNEAAVLGQVGTHPNIVDLFRADRAPQGHPYLVMRYLNGGDLREVVAENGPLSWSCTVSILRSVLEALCFAHERSVLHCDLKPANILLTDEGQPVLIDFGVSRFVGATRQPATSLGAWSFTAPECLAGEAPTAQSDLYALGAVAHLMLTGRPPVDLGGSAGAVEALAARRAAVIEPLAADAPASAAALIRSMIAVTPEQRPVSARAALQQLASSTGAAPSSSSNANPARRAPINQWWRQT